MSFKHFFVYVTTESNATSESNFHPCTASVSICLFFFLLSQCILPQVAITIWTTVTSVGRVYCMFINIIPLLTRRERVSCNQGARTALSNRTRILEIQFFPSRLFSLAFTTTVDSLREFLHSRFADCFHRVKCFRDIITSKLKKIPRFPIGRFDRFHAKVIRPAGRNFRRSFHLFSF